MRIHVAIAVVVIGASVALRPSRTAEVAIVLAVALVLGLELVNTAIEALVDLVSPEHHPLARAAKDAAAGAVLVGAAGALVVGVLVFWPGALRP
jgi:diacylglycerol kinase